MKGLVRTLKRSTPTILTVVGAAGVVATAILAVRGDRKARVLRFKELERRNRERLEARDEDVVEIEVLSKREEIELCWKEYIPAVVAGAASIAAIFGSNTLNRRQISAITGAYILLDQTYKLHKEKVTELCGKEAEQAVEAAVVKDIYKSKEKEMAKEDTSSDLLLFYEEHYGNYFRRTLAEVMDAEYRINRKLAQYGEASLNDFYEYLGLDAVEIGDALGWSQEIICDFYQPSWIDFEHQLVTMDDGMECYIINILVSPKSGYDVPF